MINSVNDEKLACLNHWPENTVGYEQEEYLIFQLNNLCKEHGYGRVSQLCKFIEEIWRDESKIEFFRAMKEERLKMLEETRKLLQRHPPGEIW